LQVFHVWLSASALHDINSGVQFVYLAHEQQNHPHFTFESLSDVTKPEREHQLEQTALSVTMQWEKVGAALWGGGRHGPAEVMNLKNREIVKSRNVQRKQGRANLCPSKHASQLTLVRNFGTQLSQT
jgi:hypothetical protein